MEKVQGKITVNHTDKNATPAHDALVFEAVKFFKEHLKGIPLKVTYEHPVIKYAYKTETVVGYMDLTIDILDYDLYALTYGSKKLISECAVYKKAYHKAMDIAEAAVEKKLIAYNKYDSMEYGNKLRDKMYDQYMALKTIEDEKQKITGAAENSYYHKYEELKNSCEFDEVIRLEVKPSIESFGNVMRQLTTYKQYKKEAHLYTHDTRFKDEFLSQEIRTYPDYKHKPK